MADPTKQQWARMPILGGLNELDSDDSLDPGQVAGAENFLFEQRRVLTRPGVEAGTMTNLTGRVVLAKNFARMNDNHNGYDFAVTDNLKVWLSTAGVPRFSSAAEIVDSGTVIDFGSGINYPVDAIMVNGVVIFTTGSAAGLWRWDYNLANPYSLLNTASAYAYITSINTRVVGAVGITTPVGFNKIGWSASGDETNWTTLDAGSLFLRDTADAISGLGTIHNVVVALRRHGIHLGTLTGVSLPVFRFENFIRKGPGCNYEGTAAFDDNRCFFVGEDNVYTFDLQNVTPIGDEIKDRLISVLAEVNSDNTPVTYRGFITRTGQLPSVPAVSGLSVKPRYRYNLVPMRRQLAAIYTRKYPHFVYDILEDKWSIHTYNFPIQYGTEFEQPAVFDDSNPSKIFIWNQQLPQEAGATLVGPVTTIEDPEYDMRVNRMLIRYKDIGTTQVEMTLDASRDAVVVSSADTQKFGNDPPTGRWMRQYFNHELVGQDFQWTLRVAPGVPLETNSVSYRYSRAGEFKGVV